MCNNPGGGGARKGSLKRGRGLTAPGPPAPLDPAEDAVLSGAGSLIPLILNCKIFMILP